MDVWGPRCWAGIVGGRGVPRDYCFIQSNLSTDNVDRLDMDWIDPLSYPYPIRSEPYLCEARIYAADTASEEEGSIHRPTTHTYCNTVILVHVD
jgi:hypothetical protein